MNEFTQRLLRTEYDYHNGVHASCPVGPWYICPKNYATFHDFVISRNPNRFPVESPTEVDFGQDFGQDSGQEEIPVENPVPVVDYHFANCDDGSVWYNNIRGMYHCSECNGWFETLPETLSQPVSEPTSINVDASATDISLMVEALSRLLENTNELLSKLVEQGKSTPVVVSLDHDRYGVAAIARALSTARKVTETAGRTGSDEW